MKIHLQKFEDKGYVKIFDKKETSCIIRLKTSSWFDKKGLHLKRSLTFLRKLCKGYNLLEEDCAVIGAEYTLSSIINLNICEDGIYEVVSCNEKRDLETGYIDDYDLKLIPYIGEKV